MANIEKLIEFAVNGEKNTNELNQTNGFPAALKPARQWFNWLFNSLTVKINELIDGLDNQAKALDNFIETSNSNQIWRDVGSNRAKNTTYTNSTGHPIFINVLVGGNDGDSDAELYVSSVRVGVFHCGYGTRGAVTISALVPNGETYRLTTGNSIWGWMELS
ncbi:hypothetical protein [Acinetobacter bereziniae]|uniref:hypothetical protein n=1 Tax=Acinetobacter bereziniae TaxID=106648 RepID=UPI00124FCAEE|nr:hypothetical protein [Acinetobacter bereziniae]